MYADADHDAKAATALRDELRELVIGVTGRTTRTQISTTQVATTGQRRVNVKQIA
jgi:hypothetical protein